MKWKLAASIELFSPEHRKLLGPIKQHLPNSGAAAIDPGEVGGWVSELAVGDGCIITQDGRSTVWTLKFTEEVLLDGLPAKTIPELECAG